MIAPPAIIVKDARISPPGGGGNLFWTLAVSPTNPEHVVACTERDHYSTAQGPESDLIYGSTDGGESWRLLKDTLEHPLNSETSCAMKGDNGIFFAVDVASGGSNPQRGEARYYLWYSPDFGKTWQLHEHLPSEDSDAILNVPSAHGSDRLFDFYSILWPNGFVGNPPHPRWLSIYENDGSHLLRLKPYLSTPCEKHAPLVSRPSPSIVLPARPGHCSDTVNLQAAVDMGAAGVGAVYTEYGRTQNGGFRSVYTLTRLNGEGTSATLPSVIATMTGNEGKALFRHGFPDFEGTIAFGRAPDSQQKRLYFAYEGLWAGRGRILVKTSNDLGAHWGSPHPADDASGDAIDPSIAVNRNGIVGILWADHNANCWHVSFSRDELKTFSRSVPLLPCEGDSQSSLADTLSQHVYVNATGSFDRFLSSKQPAGFEVHNLRTEIEWILRGMSLRAAPDGSFYALWEKLPQAHDELHFSHVILPSTESAQAMRRKAIVAAAHCCIALTGKTSNFSLYQTSFDYDPATREFEIGTVLARKRGSGGAWPIVLRAKSIVSSYGAVRASNADNDVSGKGAAWVFSGPGGDLPVSSARAEIAPLPKSKFDYSAPRILRFRLDRNLERVSAPQDSGGSPDKYLKVLIELLSTH